MFGVRSLPLKF